MAGIYIHIPFCHSKCIYCGFYSKPLSLSGGVKDFISALKNEISQRSDFFEQHGAEDKTIETIYFGGGTPSLLSIDDFWQIKGELCQNFNFSENVEFTVELNPEDITSKYACSLGQIGVNRVSLGVQSFINEHLKWMGRRHDAFKVHEAFDTLRDAGFDNISADLIFGFASLTEELLRRNLESLIELHPEHISTYQLSVDSNSILEKLQSKGKNFLLSDEESYLHYSLIQNVLQSNGYHQYEVSNFAVPEKFSRHNSNYWNRTPYVGFGPGAHSFCGNYREWNDPDTVRYIDYYGADTSDGKPAPSGSEELSETDVYNEVIMLGLRRTEGIALNVLKERIPSNHAELVEKQIAEQVERGNILRVRDDMGNEYIRIQSDKLFVSDSVIVSLML